MDINKIKVVNDSNVKWIEDNLNINDNKKLLNFDIMSIPFDYAVSYRPGARIAPQEILNILGNYSLYCSDKRVSLEYANINNIGTVNIMHDLKESYKNIEKAVEKISKDNIPIFLGGDHSITDPIIRGMKKRLQNKNIGIIMFDTHFDFREPVPGKEHSGNWLKTLEKDINYNNLAIIGISAPIYSASYMEELENRGALVKTVYDFRCKKRKDIVKEIIDHVTKNSDGIYFTVDIDSIDQAFAPGCSVPNPSGLYPYEIIDTIFEICEITNIFGIDITEVSPFLDHSQNFTSHIASHILMNFMAGNIKRVMN